MNTEFSGLGRAVVLAGMAWLISGCDSSVPIESRQLSNRVPVIHAIEITPGPEVVVGEAERVRLTVQATDPDEPDLVNGPGLQAQWVQLRSEGLPAGPLVELETPFSFTTAFAVPPAQELGDGGLITLQVTVSDGLDAVSRQVAVRLLPADEGAARRSTEVEAGADQEVDSGARVSLQATIEPVISGIAFRWRQLSGPSVALENADMAAAAFSAPPADRSRPAEIQVLEFEVQVLASDSAELISSDRLQVRVHPLPPHAGPTNVYVALNAQASENEIHKLTERTAGLMDYVFERRFQSLDNEGIVLDLSGNAVHIGDDDDDVDDARPDGTQDLTGGMSHICRIGRRDGDARFEDHVRDRDIRGSYVLPQLIENNDSGLGRQPGAKGVAYAHERGYLIVANFAARNLKVFGSAVEGDIAAFATVNLGADPWDVAYDEARDILYVASTNGVIQALDGFLDALESGETASVTRSISIVDEQGAALAQSLRGIDYSAFGDRLIVSDIGLAGEATDGALYGFRDVSALAGASRPQWVRQGASTGLGDPVDLRINGRSLLVADKLNNKLLVFQDIFSPAAAATPPLRQIELAGPESIALEFRNPPARPGVTDLRDPASLDAVLVGFRSELNTGIARLGPALGDGAVSGVFHTAEGGSRFYGMIMDVTGEAYLVSADPRGTEPTASETGALTVISRLQRRWTAPAEAEEGFVATRDRRMQDIAGSENSPYLQSPRGIDIDEERGLLLIADAVDPLISGHVLEIEIFSTCGTGERLAQVSVDALDPELRALDMAEPWGLDFDPASGDLYVAMQNGYVAVYRNFDLLYPQNPPPSFILKPQQVDPQTGTLSDATSNLRGVVYDAASDALILSDLASASSASDGQIVVIGNASVSGAEPIVQSQFSGADILIRNPLALAFDGANLYVLDDQHELLLRYDDFLSQSQAALRPAAMTRLSALGGTPVSLMLLPRYVGESPRQED